MTNAVKCILADVQRPGTRAQRHAAAEVLIERHDSNVIGDEDGGAHDLIVRMKRLPSAGVRPADGRDRSTGQNRDSMAATDTGGGGTDTGHDGRVGTPSERGDRAKQLVGRPVVSANKGVRLCAHWRSSCRE